MRAPFVRPFFAKFFYWYAGISTMLGVFVVLAFPAAFQKLIGPELGMILNTASRFMVIVLIAQGVWVASIGYVIELLAKIEWNTRTDNLQAGGYGGSTGSAAISDKQYYFIDKGPMNGPLSAPAMLDLYREGKVSNSARLYVEENGQRRLLKNWSEVGL